MASHKASSVTHVAYAALIASVLALTVWGEEEVHSDVQGGGSFRDLTADGAWCWFADPRAVYIEGAHRRTYAGWVTTRGDVQLGAYDHDTQSIDIVTLHEVLQYDDHCVPGILALPDNRLIIFYSRHNGPSMFYRTSKNPENIFSFGEERTMPTNTGGNRGYCYANPFQLKSEDNLIYLFWRGGNFKPTYATSPDGLRWTQARTFIQGAGARPYTKYVSNGRDTIHVAFTDGHPRKEPANAIYYAAYRDGALYRPDGTKIKDMTDLPLAPGEADKVYDAGLSGRAWIWDIALDKAGNPVLVYAAMPEEHEHYYRYARWTGARWEDHQVCAAGRWFPQTPPGQQERELHYSGGIVLDHANPSIVYLSRLVGGVFEIEKCVTSDAGATWTSQPITHGSKRLNVRPFMPRGYPGGEDGLLWMHGDYPHYSKFKTGIKMNRLRK